MIASRSSIGKLGNKAQSNSKEKHYIALGNCLSIVSIQRGKSLFWTLLAKKVR